MTGSGSAADISCHARYRAGVPRLTSGALHKQAVRGDDGQATAICGRSEHKPPLTKRLGRHFRGQPLSDGKFPRRLGGANDVIRSDLEYGRGQHGLDLTCLIEERLRLDRSPATASPTFFPCELRPHSSRAKKVVSGPPSIALRSLRDAVRSSPIHSTVIEDAMVAA